MLPACCKENGRTMGGKGYPGLGQLFSTFEVHKNLLQRFLKTEMLGSRPQRLTHRPGARPKSSILTLPRLWGSHRWTIY